MSKGNKLYDKYLERLNDPKVRALLHVISGDESGTNSSKWNKKEGGGQTKIPFKREYNKRKGGTSAQGAFQITNATWLEHAKKLGLDEINDASIQNQRIVALSIADETGALTKAEKGDFEGAIHAAAKKWAALPLANGKSIAEGHYEFKPKSVSVYTNRFKQYVDHEKVKIRLFDEKGDVSFVKEPKGNSTLTKNNQEEWKNIENVETRPIPKKEKKVDTIPIKKQAAEVKQTPPVKTTVMPKKNEVAEKTKTSSASKFAVAEKYLKEIDKIKSLKLGAGETNKRIVQLESDYTESGKIDEVNEGIKHFNKRDDAVRELITLESKFLKGENITKKDLERMDFLNSNLGVKANSYSKILKDIDEGNINNDGTSAKNNGLLDKFGFGKFQIRNRTVIDPESGPIKDLFTQESSINTLNLIPGTTRKKIFNEIHNGKSTHFDFKSKGLKPIDKKKYLKEKDDKVVDEKDPKEDKVKDQVDGTTSKTPEEIAAEAKKNADEAKLLEEKNKKPYDGTETLNKFKDPGQHVDTQFQYTPGKQKFPLDSLIGLTTGLMGAAAADSVDIKYRDEQVAEGMLQYAEDIAKIKNMGLDPAIEGSLKQKLADGYQTGLENIVRASNGNRNLVLGNQGQLDQARMKGIVDIVAMDVDRSDKALAAFGEVQKYINDFETNKSIANNERKYQEDQKKQMAGMQLASAGMSNFIDSIQASKENAPGSINDMKRQWFQFQTTGILPNAKEGEPGSLSYKMKKQEDIKIFNGKVRTYADWINSKNKDDQNLIAKILDKNPQMNPLTNKAEGENATRFEDLEKMFDDLSGNEESKKAYLDDRGISDLDVKKAEAQKVVLTPEQRALIDKNKKVDGTTVVLDAQKKIKDAENSNKKIVINADGTITTADNRTIVGTTVTKEGLSTKTIEQKVKEGVAGIPNGPETIDPTKNANQLAVEEYNSIKEEEENQL